LNLHPASAAAPSSGGAASAAAAGSVEETPTKRIKTDTQALISSPLGDSKKLPLGEGQNTAWIYVVAQFRKKDHTAFTFTGLRFGSDDATFIELIDVLVCYNQIHTYMMAN
jgi:hypothetical protein